MNPTVKIENVLRTFDSFDFISLQFFSARFRYLIVTELELAPLAQNTVSCANSWTS